MKRIINCAKPEDANFQFRIRETPIFGLISFTLVGHISSTHDLNVVNIFCGEM